MGTRGSITFVANGEEKTCYNHFDSYPECLGETVREFVENADLDELPARIGALTVVDEESDPTAAQIKKLNQHANPGVGGPITNTVVETWYQLLRNTQGDPEAILASGFLLDASTFPADSLFCEWGYVIDTDARVFEVYRGFQKEAHEDGRFHAMERMTTHDGSVSEYYPIRLVKSWGFDEIPDEDEFAAWSKGLRLAQEIEYHLERVEDEDRPFYEHVAGKIEDGMTPDDALAELRMMDEGEAADYIDEEIPESEDVDEWCEAALSEFGFEGCGENMSGIRGMARYVYNRSKVSEATAKVREWIDEA